MKKQKETTPTRRVDLPTTRKEAREAGITMYFTGLPCLRGHLSKRVTSTAACYECVKIFKAGTRREYNQKREDSKGRKV